jgi:hypothetical protein
MITELTQEQKDAMPKYVDKWIGIGTNTDRLDCDTAVTIIHDIQTHLLSSKETPVVIFDNPIECWVACNLTKNGTLPENLKAETEAYFVKGKKMEMESFSMPYTQGSFDASIFSFYDFFKDEVKIDYGDLTKNYEIWRRSTELGLIFFMDDIVCIVSEKPTVIKLNEERRAHCDGGPAISYAGWGNEGKDGHHIYMLNGVRVPKWLAVEHTMKIAPERYTEITNADIRMEFVRKIGIERMLELGKKLDTYENYENEWWTKSQYELWDMSCLFPGITIAPHVKMLNPTVGVWHVEAVSPECLTLPTALKDRFGGIELDIFGMA